MKRIDELIALLKIENQPWEKNILQSWIKRDGIDLVYKECLKIIEEAKKSK